MLPSLSIDRRIIAPGVESTVRVLLELAAPPAAMRPGPPLDVVVVLDPSVTGGSDPLSAAAEATTELLRVVRPDDRIGVVAVDHDVVQVLPLGHHDPELATRAIRAWRTDRSGTAEGGRSIATALLAAAARDGADQRVVVLTDAGPAVRLAALFGNAPIACDVVVTVRVTSAVARFGLLRPLTGSSATSEMSEERAAIALGDTFGGEVRRVALTLDVAPSFGEGPLDLGEVCVHWTAPGADGAAYTIELPVTVEVHVVGHMNH